MAKPRCSKYAEVALPTQCLCLPLNCGSLQWKNVCQHLQVYVTLKARDLRRRDSVSLSPSFQILNLRENNNSYDDYFKEGVSVL